MLDKTGKDSSNYNAENIRLIQEASPFVGQWIEKEYERQKNNVELIASENLVSPEVMATMGSVSPSTRPSRLQPVAVSGVPS